MPHNYTLLEHIPLVVLFHLIIRKLNWEISISYRSAVLFFTSFSFNDATISEETQYESAERPECQTFVSCLKEMQVSSWSAEKEKKHSGNKNSLFLYDLFSFYGGSDPVLEVSSSSGISPLQRKTGFLQMSRLSGSCSPRYFLGNDGIWRSESRVESQEKMQCLDKASMRIRIATFSFPITSTGPHPGSISPIRSVKGSGLQSDFLFKSPHPA